MMRILVVEDETMVAQHLCRVIRDILQQRIQSLSNVDNIEEARLYLKTHSIDLLLLDLNLGGDDGFELLSTMIASDFQTIIVSGNTDQALKSYEYGVLDFVPKPFTSARLSQALARVEQTEEEPESGQGNAKYLGIRYLGNLLLVPVADITYIRASERYSELTLVNKKVHLHERKLKQLMMILPEQYQRVHRSHIVNLSFAAKIISYPGSRYVLCMQDGSMLNIGRKFLPFLRQRLL